MFVFRRGGSLTCIFFVNLCIIYIIFLFVLLVDLFISLQTCSLSENERDTKKENKIEIIIFTARGKRSEIILNSAGEFPFDERLSSPSFDSNPPRPSFSPVD